MLKRTFIRWTYSIPLSIIPENDLRIPLMPLLLDVINLYKAKK